MAVPLTTFEAGSSLRCFLRAEAGLLASSKLVNIGKGIGAKCQANIHFTGSVTALLPNLPSSVSFLFTTSQDIRTPVITLQCFLLQASFMQAVATSSRHLLDSSSLPRGLEDHPTRGSISIYRAIQRNVRQRKHKTHAISHVPTSMVTRRSSASTRTNPAVASVSLNLPRLHAILVRALGSWIQEY